ncbi:hypothetical protein ACXIT0_03435 [Methylorubrum extorquens]
MRTSAHSIRLPAASGPDPIQRLARLELPAPACAQEVVADFDRWVAGNVPDEIERYFMLEPDGAPPRTRRERVLTDLLRLLGAGPEAWLADYDCGRLAGSLRDIERELAPAPAVLTHLRAGASTFAAAGWRRVRSDPDRLLAFLAGTSLEATEDGIAVPDLHAVLPLGELMDCLAGDGLALYRLRDLLAGEKAAFDHAVAARRDALTPAVERGVGRLFEAFGPPPAEYLAAFGTLLRDARWLPIVLGKLASRAGLRDGFEGAPSVAEWLWVLAGARVWTPDDVRCLVRLDALFEGSPDAFAAATLAAAGALALMEPGSTVFAALSLLLLARRQRVAGSRLSDAEREGKVELEVGELPLGPEILGLHRRLSDLPLDEAGARCTWTYLGNGEKGLWQWRMRKAVEGDQALRRGLAEFLLAWAPREVYADLERLVVAILPSGDELAFLRALARSPDSLVSLRAGCLAQDLPFETPAGMPHQPRSNGQPGKPGAS